MRLFAAPLLLLSMLSLSGAACAAGMIKPGLWEMSMKSDSMKNMPRLSPEQMEQMRKMGVNVPQSQGGAMVSKVCVTKEMAERNQVPMKNESGCQSKNYQRSGNSYSVDIVCSGPDLKGEGKVKGTFSSPEVFSSTYDFKGTAHGQPVVQKMEHGGKWLAADCGNVKPMADPRK